MKPIVSIGGGVLLLTISVCGLIHGIRAGLAQAIYHETKFGEDVEENDPLAVSRRCAYAHRLYPHNYLFCIWTAEKAYYNRFRPNGKERQDYLDTAKVWSDIGLNLNFYKSSLRLLKTRLLKRDSPAAAITYWEKYVDWQFWEPYNHAVLVKLYAAAGNFGKAMESLTWVEGSKHHADAYQKLRDAWQHEMALPKEAHGGTPAKHPQR